MKDLSKHSNTFANFRSLRENWKSDLQSGFLVFLIALPLCLGISMASNFPPVAGIITAIIGGILVGFLGGSELTIKGPAAGLIVIALGSVEELGKGDPMKGYLLTLGIIVVSGLIQIVLGILKSGILSDFFPSAAVHGMLASIGMIIISKQVHTLLGVKPESKETLELILEISKSFTNLNPKIFIIGLLSLLILFIMPSLKLKFLKSIPSPLLVLFIAIPLGRYFDLEHEHTYLFLDGHEYKLGPTFLVTLPDNIVNAFSFPDFSEIFSPVSWKYIIMFAMIGSLESLLSTKAIDTLDPYKRKSDMNKDLTALGFGNVISGLIGGLPMISEIVRSSANINNGAKTRWSNFFHGLFMLIFVVFFPKLIHQIPLAALSAMLIYTGYRLASPREFYKTYKIGKEQLLIFLTTIILTLATDLLIGIAAGIIVKLLVHFLNGLNPKYMFKPLFTVMQSENQKVFTVDVYHSAVFSNFLKLKSSLEKLPKKSKIIIDFSNSYLVDHTVMESIYRFKTDYESEGGEVQIEGLDNLQPLAKHELSARKKRKISDSPPKTG